LPSTITASNLQDVISQIPDDTSAITNALTWMNGNMQKSHANLGNALQGQSVVEGFDANNNNCQDTIQCVLNNPDLLQQVQTNINELNRKSLNKDEQLLVGKINPFLNNAELNSALSENNTLLSKSQDIQNQAQSGELVNQINVPGGNTVATYPTLPGANNMIDMKQNNPERYNELKQNYGQWFFIKQVIDGINSSL
jgi:hypothetical protein